ncbi:MAG: hypothetical protein A2138_00925 [Deltaproteobacteria bacterium RBG_16_71_12]|nr:MAG: hypothetical protein A2138_00925 [Deltaproteobacteria bacterium RBG_16_71_12]
MRARRWFAAGDGRLRLSDRDLDRTDAGSDARRREVIADLHALTRAKVEAAEPAVRALVHEEARRLEERAAHAVDDQSTRRALRGFKIKLYPYQLHGVSRFLTRMRLLLADDMGLGKTAQAIACAHVLWQSERVKRALVVVPASLKSQWQREWQRFTDAPLTMIDGSPDERRRAYRQARGFLLVNYEQVIKDLPELLRMAPDAVFLDEAQRMKNWATKTATFIKALSPRWRLALTGTPMENRLDDLASILDWIDDRALAPAWRLGPWHSTYADGVRGVVGARNLDTLRMRIAGTVVRRLRKEVLDQLPPRTDVRVPAAMTEAQRAEHAELDRPIASLVNRAKRRPLSQEEFLQLMTLLAAQRTICNGLALRHFADVFPGVAASTRPSDAQLESLSSPKLIELRAVLRALIVDQRRKVVVFSQWRRMLELCAWATRDILDDAGLRCVFFTGNESQKRRTQNIVDFHDDDTAAVLYCTDAGGVGLNLQRAANACINVELPWNPAVLEQRVGRIYRLGQESPIDVFHLVTDGGIEPRIASLVADKRAVFTGLFDGSSDAVAFDRSGSFMDRIEQLVAPQQAPAVPQAAVDDEADDAEVDAVGASVEEPVEEPVEQAPVEPAVDTASAPVQAPVPLDLAALFGQVRVSMSHDGCMTLTAPPEAARTLAGVLSGMARLLEAQPAR